jgi:hypothetical protein
VHRRVLAFVSLCAACGPDAIRVTAKTADYNHGKLGTAIDRFVAANRTPEAFAELARTVATLRTGMDRAVAEEAERKLLVLALGPVQAVATKPLAERVDALAITVWPTLLAPPIEADALLHVRDTHADDYPVHAGESATAYLVRVCGSALAAECKRIVPEMQGAIVNAVATRRATERMRNAVGDCLDCEGDRGWRDAMATWEALDREVAEWMITYERRGDPNNWLVAGAAAEDDPQLPEAEVSPRGDLLLGDHAYGPNQRRIAALRELRGGGEFIALHLHPDVTLAQARAILADARKAGLPRVAAIARESAYPFRRRAYWIAEGTGLRVNLRPTDSLQLLVHAIDEVAGPGTVARVD